MIDWLIRSQADSASRVLASSGHACLISCNGSVLWLTFVEMLVFFFHIEIDLIINPSSGIFLVFQYSSWRGAEWLTEIPV